MSDKDKEALFNIAYNVTDNISSQATLRHNNIFNRCLPVLLYLPSTTPFLRASARELLVPFLHLWYGAAVGFERRPPAPNADALPTELLRQSEQTFLGFVCRDGTK